MWLMAGIAWQAVGMLGGDNGGKPLGLGGIRFVAARTQNAGVRQRRFDRRWIFRVFTLRPVARLAVDPRVTPRRLHRQHVGVARFANLVAGVNGWKRCDLAQRIPAVMSVLAEALWNKPCSKTKNRGSAQQENRGDAN